jgi:acyl-CoA reductase-like NAD-dependent aldehyde dehydrogenase
MANTRQITRLNALNADFRFALQGPTFKEHDVTGKLVQVNNGGVTCEIFDRTVGKMYAKATANDNSLALDAALDAAEKAEKPMTPAQEADKKNGRRAKDLAAENAELRKRLAALEGKDKTEAPPEPPAIEFADPANPSDEELDAALRNRRLANRKKWDRSRKIAELEKAGVIFPKPVEFQAGATS